MPELIQIIEHLKIFIGVGCLVYAMSTAWREIQVTWKRQQERGIASTLRDSKKFSISRYFELTFVLFNSALFSLLLVNSFVQKTSISDFQLLLWAVLITFATTGSLFAMWYVEKAELGIAMGAILTLSSIFVKPEDHSYIWLSIFILVFIAATMWIYEFGNPLEKNNQKQNKLISILIILTLFIFPTINLGIQFHYNLLQNETTPKRFKIEHGSFHIEQKTNIKDFLEQSFSKYRDKNNSGKIDKLRSLKEQKFLYALLSEIYLGDKLYLDSYLSTHKKYFLNEISKNEEGRSSNETETSIKEKRNKSVNELTQIFAHFDQMNRGDKVKFLANRLQWIYPVGDNDKRVDIPLPGITAKERFIKLANARTCNALLNTGDAQILLESTDFSYDQDAKPIKYQPDEKYKLNQQFKSVNQPNSNCSYEKEFTEISNKPFSSLLLKQMALPYKEEAYLALREYNNLAKDILHDKKYNTQSDYFYDKDIDEGTKRAFINYFTEDHGLDNYKAFNKLIKYSNYKVDFKSSDKTREKLEEVKDVIHRSSEFLCQYNTQTSQNRKESNQRVIGLSTSATKQEEFIDFLHKSIACLKKPEDLERVRNLVELNTSEEYPLYYLFDNDIRDFPNSQDEDEQKRTFSYLKNSIHELMINEDVVYDFRDAKFIEEQELEKQLMFDSWKRTIEDFFSNQPNNKNININTGEKLKQEAQEEILFNIAYLLYDSIENSFLSFLNKIVIAATFINLTLGQFVALLFQLPLSLAAIILAQYSAQILVTRDRLGTILLSEKFHQAKSRYTIGKTDMIRGRDSTISEMKKRAGRGWSSIAIVGRRGVGKTRILYELVQPNHNNPHPKTITAWISAPTQFNESEFVESVLERLTADIEYTVAQRLGVKPLEIRQSETNQTIVGFVIYCLFLLIFASVTVSVFPSSQGVIPDKATFIMLPVGSIIVCSIGCLIFHYINLQPVNLSSWLEKDRASNPQTALLYRDMRRINAFLEQRRTSPSASGKKESISSSSVFLMSVAALVILYSLSTIIGLWFFASLFGAEQNLFSSINPIQVLLFILIAILLIIALLLALKREVTRMRGYSLITLVSEYREFLEKVVYRIREGALGIRPDEDFEIIVCIDELDKIVDPAELRNFIRRIKVIFEIPGVYYYLSLSEDALRAFYLGTADGKNEVDSAFDHIIYVPPVDCDLGEEIAKTYLDKHSTDLRKPGLERTIAATSYGVPRDILRRCDEIVAKGNMKDILPSQVCDDLRTKIAELAYGEEILTKQETLKFTNNDIYIVFEEVEVFLSKNSSNIKALRVVLAIWLLALLALSTESIDVQWRQTSEDLRKIGYRIADENPENLIEELKHIQETIWSL